MKYTNGLVIIGMTASVALLSGCALVADDAADEDADLGQSEEALTVLNARIRTPLAGRCANLTGDIQINNVACSTTNPFHKWNVSPWFGVGNPHRIQNVGAALAPPTGFALAFCMGVASVAGGEPVQPVPCSAADPLQQWQITAVGGGRYRICQLDPVGAEQCITAGAAGANMALLPRDPSNALQQFFIAP